VRCLQIAKKIVELKTEGNNSFARGDYQKALTTYDEAIKLLPTGAPERADFHNNKAACFIGQKRCAVPLHRRSVGH
jgi:hypothetical protein